jgi:hypothetical protein
VEFYANKRAIHWCLKRYFIINHRYNGGQKFRPLTYAVKQPLGTNNLTSHVDMCQSNCVCSYGSQ